MTDPPPDVHTQPPWQHRMAVALTLVTFPLIWAGGLVTTYEAGMAVPDWPSTYGYNLLLYPYQTWLFGPWDLFLEHGHRLLGAAAGMVTIAFLAITWKTDPRRWMKNLAATALVAVTVQGCLGGARVLLDERMLAMLHGCFGPAFFGLCVCLAVFTSSWWRMTDRPHVHPGARRLHQLAWLTTLLAITQVILGAQLRHLPYDATPGAFRATLLTHLMAAGALAFHVAALTWVVWRRHRQAAPLRRAALLLAALLTLQLLLGCGAYVVSYYWPNWSQGYQAIDSYTITAAGMLESTIVTGHAATGSLVLGAALVVLLRSLRAVGPEPQPIALEPNAASLRLAATK